MRWAPGEGGRGFKHIGNQVMLRMPFGVTLALETQSCRSSTWCHAPNVAAFLSSHAHDEASICKKRLGDPVPALINTPVQVQMHYSWGLEESERSAYRKCMAH